MNLNSIPFEEFNCNPFRKWSKDWLLLTAGSFQEKSFNSMTVGWGGFGAMWGHPLAMIVVRPQRHTIHFLENFNSFTLCSFPEELRGALSFCGSKSGRDVADKAAEAGLNAVSSEIVAAPSFREAELVIECRKSFVSDMKSSEFVPHEAAGQLYPQGDYHRIYFGEIMRIRGTELYRK